MFAAVISRSFDRRCAAAERNGATATARRAIPEPLGIDEKGREILSFAARRRLEVFCAAYGDPGIGPPEVTAAAIAKLRELVAFIVDSAAAGDPAQTAVLERGDVAIYERDIAYLEG
jgi:hypothetical protein